MFLFSIFVCIRQFMVHLSILCQNYLEKHRKSLNLGNKLYRFGKLSLFNCIHDFKYCSNVLPFVYKCKKIQESYFLLCQVGHWGCLQNLVLEGYYNMISTTFLCPNYFCNPYDFNLLNIIIVAFCSCIHQSQFTYQVVNIGECCHVLFVFEQCQKRLNGDSFYLFEHPVKLV